MQRSVLDETREKITVKIGAGITSVILTGKVQQQKV